MKSFWWAVRINWRRKFMPKKTKKTNVDIWLTREKVHAHIRKALENASSYFDKNDSLTVNTLEAIYARESSFGTQLGTRGIKVAAGHFHFQRDTAERYHLIVSKDNDQRFDIDYASIAAARYLDDLDRSFSKNEVEFARKSSADKTAKDKKINKSKGRCTKGHWVTIDDHPVFICD